MDTRFEKNCAHCTFPKPIGEFGETGRGRFCRGCKVLRKRLGQQRYVQRNPDKQAAMMQRWRKQNAAHVQAYDARYYAEHLDYYQAKAQQYHAEHREELRAYNTQWRLDNPEYHLHWRRQHTDEEAARMRVWRAQNPQRVKLGKMRRQAREVGLPATMTDEDVAFLYHYWHFCCAICGKEEGLFRLQLVLDHWIALAADGCPGTVPTNMVLLCHGRGGCNNAKNDAEPVAWLTRRYGPRKAQKILRKVEAYFAVVRQS